LSKKNKEKNAYGIFFEGLKVRIAHLVSNGKSIEIKQLDHVNLHGPLFDETPHNIAPTQSDEGDEFILPEDADYEDGQFSLPEITEFDDDVGFDDQEAEYDETGVDNRTSMEIFQQLCQRFKLTDGKVGLNAIDEKVSYHQFDKLAFKGNLKKTLQTELLTKAELKAKKFELNYLINSDKSVLSYVHKGEFDLLKAVSEANSAASITKKIIISHIDPNEITLMNLVRLNSDFPPEDIVLILYVDSDFKTGILYKGMDFLKNFNLVINEIDPSRRRDTVYSKVMLEQDVSGIDTIHHIVLAGQISRNEDIAFFREKFTSVHTVSRLELNNIDVFGQVSNKYKPIELAEYAIPIGLAWKALEPDNKKFLKTNLLPIRIIERQKHFKIAWHGIVIFIIMAISSSTWTFKGLELDKEIENAINFTKKIESQVSQNKIIIEKINGVQKRTSEMAKKAKLIDEIIGKKNQWHRYLLEISRVLSKNKISWISSMSGKENTFTIKGYATKRNSIIAISKLYPGSEFDASNIKLLEKINALNFDITFPFPDKIVPEEKEPEKVEAPPKKPVKKSMVKQIVEKVKNISVEEVKNQGKSITPSQEYSNLVNIYLKGDLETAFTGFLEFVRKYPDHKKTYNAQYLIGECLFIKNELEDAKLIFQTTIGQGGYKTADAILMMARIYRREGNYSKALEYLSKIKQDYPNHKLSKTADTIIKAIEEDKKNAN